MKTFNISLCAGIAASCILSFALLTSSCSKPVQGDEEDRYEFVRSYDFDENGIPRNVLESYLSRSISQSNFCQPGKEAEFQENLRMLKNIGAKFIGRAAFEWTPEMENEQHFARVRKYTEMAHQADPEMIIQACVFEAIFPVGNKLSKPGLGVDAIPVPDWVFEEFGLPVENRNFNYKAMLFQDGRWNQHWANTGGVPDITQLETQMYFFYRAARYIDVGIEAIHWGQLQMIGANDKNVQYKNWISLLDRVRRYAKTHSRRGWVIFDAHAGKGCVVDGKLLLDFHSFPLRPIEVTDNSGEYKCALKIGYLDSIYHRSKGGITPSGWSCKHLPYLVEWDNSGADKNHLGNPNNPTKYWPWGWDEITWFAHCSPEYRAEFMHYAWDWLKKNDPDGFLKMPGCTSISADPIWFGDHLQWNYLLNNKSEACPYGFGQEDVVKEIWANDR